MKAALTSLRGRLLIAASAVLMAFLGTMGLALENAFRTSAIDALNARLLQRVYGLLSVTEDAGAQVTLPDALVDPLLNQLDSGHYGYVLNASGQVIWQSQSAFDQALPEGFAARLIENLAVGASDQGQTGGVGPSMRYFAFGIQWLGEVHQGRYTYVVMEDERLLSAEVEGFRTRVWTWLIGMVAALLLLQWLIMRWGLRPLASFTEDLKAMGKGEHESLEGPYVQEFRPLADTLNRLVRQERNQRERYRLTLADLAHSLKTPLAVMGSVLQGKVFGASQVDEMTAQITHMDQVIGYQLSRAVIASSPEAKQAVDSEAVLSGLLLALNKVYADKSITVSHRFDKGLCRADPRDLHEAWGNLLDNAFKYGRSQVHISSRVLVDQVILLVEDDGPGIAPEQETEVLKRGVRVDVKTAGQGLGLAIVSEIAERYDGTLEVGRSPKLGGAAITLVLSTR